MKRSKTGIYIMLLQAAVLLAGLFAAASTVPDLSTITQRNGGVFPVARVRKVIIGDEVIVGHGSREMPIWGPIFHEIQEDRDYGDVRLQNVTDYLKSIQK